MRGETHAVSLLHQLAQILQFQLEIKETVTPGEAPLHACVLSNSLRMQQYLLLLSDSPSNNTQYITVQICSQSFKVFV